MAFIFKCPYCKDVFEAEDRWIGRVAICPTCGKKVVIQRCDDTADGVPPHGGYGYKSHAGNNGNPGGNYGPGQQASPPPFGRSAEDIKRNAEETIRKTFKLDQLEGFSFSRFMRQVFKHHPWEEVEEYMSLGTPHNIPPLSEVQPIWPAPWLFLRTMLFTVLLYLFLIWKQDLFGTEYILLPLLIVGVIGIPFATLLFFWEVNVPKNISMLSLLRIVIISGFASIAVTLLINNLVGNPEHPVWAGPVEEPAKALIILLFIRNPKHRFKLNGLLIGAAVGAGFAVIESGGYTFRNGDNGTMEIRALLAPFMHIPWSAIVGCALWRAKNLPGSFSSNLMSSTFLPLFALSIGLHMFWNWLIERECLITTAIAGAVEYFIIIYLIQEGINEVRKIKAEN